MQGGIPLGSGSRCLLCGLFSLMPVMGIVGPFQQLFRYAVSLRGIVLFGLPARNVLNLASGLIFQRQAVAGHGLCHLGFSFQLFQWVVTSYFGHKKSAACSATLSKLIQEFSFRRMGFSQSNDTASSGLHHLDCLNCSDIYCISSMRLSSNTILISPPPLAIITKDKISFCAL